MRMIRATVVLGAMLILAGCFPIVIVPGQSHDPGESPGTETAERTPQESALLTFLRSHETAKEELAWAEDDDLLTTAQSICTMDAEGTDIDRGLRALADEFQLSDGTLIALVSGAQVAYCPDDLDTSRWLADSTLMRERLFLRTVRDGAGSFGQFPDATALGLGRSICETLDAGGQIEEIIPAMHAERPGGLAPDRAGAIAFISASIVAFCPQHSTSSG